MKQPTSSKLSASVMDEISNGRVKMRSSAYFTALTVLSIACIALIGLIGSYLSSILFYWIRIVSADTMAWGARANLVEALQAFPWWTLPLLALLFGLAVWLIRRQGTVYRFRLRWIMLIAIIGVLMIGALFSTFGIGAFPHEGQYQNSTGSPGYHGGR